MWPDDDNTVLQQHLSASSTPTITGTSVNECPLNWRVVTLQLLVKNKNAPHNVLQEWNLHFKAVFCLVDVKVHALKEVGCLELLVHVGININAPCVSVLVCWLYTGYCCAYRGAWCSLMRWKGRTCGCTCCARVPAQRRAYCGGVSILYCVVSHTYAHGGGIDVAKRVRGDVPAVAVCSMPDGGGVCPPHTCVPVIVVFTTYGEMMARTLVPLLGTTSANHLLRLSASCFAARTTLRDINERVEAMCAYHRPHTTCQRAAVAC